MSGVGSRETGLDSLFASKPVGPGFEPCLGQSANLAGAPKPLCLSFRAQSFRPCYAPRFVGRESEIYLLLSFCTWDVDKCKQADGSSRAADWRQLAGGVRHSCSGPAGCSGVCDHRSKVVQHSFGASVGACADGAAHSPDMAAQLPHSDGPGSSCSDAGSHPSCSSIQTALKSAAPRCLAQQLVVRTPQVCVHVRVGPCITCVKQYSRAVNLSLPGLAGLSAGSGGV